MRHFLYFLIITLAIPTHATDEDSRVGGRVIYGDDDRLDIYEVKEQRALQWADATVALIERGRLQSEAKEITKIQTRHFGESYGLCPDEAFREQPTAAFCSGFFVGTDLIVTAGHCIVDEQECQGTAFVFGFHIASEGEAQIRRPNSEVYFCKQLVASKTVRSGADYAVIRLDRAVSGHKPLTVSDSSELRSGDPLTVIGHPAGLPTKVSGGAWVRSLEQDFFVANLDTYGGNSGSAVMGMKSGNVEGILVRGEMDFVSVGGCRKSHVCEDDGCRGEDVTLARTWKALVD